MKYTLEVEPTGLADGLDMRGKRAKSRMTPKFFRLHYWFNGSAID